MVFLNKYTISQLTCVFKEILLDLKTLLAFSGEKEITLREAAGYNSHMNYEHTIRLSKISL